MAVKLMTINSERTVPPQQPVREQVAVQELPVRVGMPEEPPTQAPAESKYWAFREAIYWMKLLA